MHTPLTISLSVTPAEFILLQPDVEDWTAAAEGPGDPGVSVAITEEVVVVARGTSGEERETVKREKREEADRRDLILDRL